MRDQHELAMRCQAIERSGGSVLDWLKGQGFISAKATWQRLQLNELERKRYELTDGRGDAKAMRAKVTPEQKRTAVFIAIKGGDPAKFLGECGSKNGKSMWDKVRADLKKEDPELYRKLAEATGPKPAEEPETEETKETEITEEPEAEEANPEGPDDREEPEQPEAPEAPQPAEGRITRPVCYDGFEIQAMQSTKTGIKYTYNPKFGWFEIRSGQDELCLKLDEWNTLLAELPKAARILGVELL